MELYPSRWVRGAVEDLVRLLDGRTSEEIGKALDISPKTVDVHRANLMRKMGAATRAESVRMMGRSNALPQAGHPHTRHS